jgi:hypothetical protein
VFREFDQCVRYIVIAHQTSRPPEFGSFLA